MWALFSPERLSRTAHTLITESSNELLFSEANLAELLNKCGRGKLPVAGASVASLHQDILDLRVLFQPIDRGDIITAAGLPHHHSDPFDRLLISQAIRQHVPIVTVDMFISRYAVETIW